MHNYFRSKLSCFPLLLFTPVYYYCGRFCGDVKSVKLSFSLVRLQEVLSAKLHSWHVHLLMFNNPFFVIQTEKRWHFLIYRIHYSLFCVPKWQELKINPIYSVFFLPRPLTSARRDRGVILGAVYHRGSYFWHGRLNRAAVLIFYMGFGRRIQVPS